jgi:hypothetical protein
VTHHRTDRTITSIVGLAEGLTTKLPAARAVLLEQRLQLDGLVGRAYDGDRITGGKAELTTVERLASQQQHIDRQLRDLSDNLNAVVLTLRNLHRDCDATCSTRTEHVIDQCRDGQVGKDGTLDWGDATCQDGATKGGLCSRHYMAWYRWRQANGVDTSRMFQPAGL